MSVFRYVLPCLLIVVAAAALASCGGDEDGGGLDSDYPAAGEDRFELTRATVEIEYTFDSVAALPVAGALERIELQGPTRISRSDPQDKDGDGRVEVATEIVEMELTGTASFGSLTVRLNPDESPTGMVEQQQPGKDFPADSFFDVFVQVELPSANGGSNVIGLNEEPLRMEAELTNLPPGEGDEYRTAGGEAVPLVSVNDATLRLGRIVDALHIPNPAPGPGATETPEKTPTEEPEETPTGEPSVYQALVDELVGCQHRGPGDSVLQKLVYIFLVDSSQSRDHGADDPLALVLVTEEGAAPQAEDNAAPAAKEPLAGATVTVTASGAGLLPGEESERAVTNTEGKARTEHSINKFGSYELTVVEVAAADGTRYQFAPDSKLTETFEVGQTCNSPEGW